MLEEPNNENIYKLILTAISEKPEGLHTVRTAAKIAAATDARLVIYHAIDVTSIPLPPDSPLFRETLNRLRERSKALLDAAAAIAESIGVRRVDTIKLEGDPVEGLWIVIKRIGRPDLIVVGRPRSRAIGIIGARLHSILRGAPVSVLIVGQELSS